MKNLLFIILLFAAPFGYASDSLDQIEINSTFAAVSFDVENESLIITFCDTVKKPCHSVIDIMKTKNLAYKTRIMRYFGGLVVNDTYKFRHLVVIVDGKRHVYEWNRYNVSLIVNKMCAHATRPMS